MQLIRRDQKGAPTMAFQWTIRTERMASCSHQANSATDKTDDPTSDTDTTLPLFCVRCHSISAFGTDLVCLVCQQHFAG